MASEQLIFRTCIKPLHKARAACFRQHAKKSSDSEQLAECAFLQSAPVPVVTVRGEAPSLTIQALALRTADLLAKSG
jgi:hypothetical protein